MGVSAGHEEEGAGARARSFRHEDYNNRRVFLRSYPLNWRGEDQEEEEDGMGGDVSKDNKGGLKGRILAVFQLGRGKALLIPKLKQRVALYFVACHRFGFKPTTSFLSV